MVPNIDFMEAGSQPASGGAQTFTGSGQIVLEALAALPARRSRQWRPPSV
jgi:hypothetical protein